jgi:hypothetical protein
MSEGFYWPILTFGCTIIFVWLLIRGFRTGTMEFGYWGTSLSGRRVDQPVRFWAVAALLAFYAAGAAFATIGMIFFPDGLAF